MSQNQNLSAAQLAAIDLMIAHMQEKGETQLGGFWDSITDGIQAAASAVGAAASVIAATAATAANAAANAVTVAANAVADAVPAAVEAVAEAAPAVAEAIVEAAPVVAEVAAAALAAHSTSEDVAALVNTLNKNGLQSHLSLENLIKIRNQYSK
ncbi:MULTISPECIES: hypothetical protein [Mucilaginibacter]|uniref:Uncharacterized protein n=1 Tax=Mucilaginibacter gilvus TaxID=2305909 RepID=A0A444MJV2_9SPHI|nr:hypothetical protein [Mucilaginibacter gilvus]RWY49126.1 hypothetical protein EPL05_17035 [Mucilaginibacter gilvus]